MRILILIICLLATNLARAEIVFPAPQGYVNDYAQMLSIDQKYKLQNELIQFDRQTTNQVVVATFNSLNGNSLENFSIKLVQQWKIGSQKHDNGVLLLIIKNDHKIRIEVGYGLEGVLTDAISSSIIRNQISPSFKNGDYNTGIQNGITAILQATKGEYKAENSSTETNFYNTLWFWIAISIMIFLLTYGYVRQLGIKIPIVETIFLFLAWLLAQQNNKNRFPNRYDDFSNRSGRGNSDDNDSGGFSGGGGRFGGGGASGGW